jgi:hypothetical protein
MVLVLLKGKNDTHELLLGKENIEIDDVCSWSHFLDRFTIAFCMSPFFLVLHPISPRVSFSASFLPNDMEIMITPLKRRSIYLNMIRKRRDPVRILLHRAPHWMKVKVSCTKKAKWNLACPLKSISKTYWLSQCLQIMFSSTHENISHCDSHQYCTDF